MLELEALRGVGEPDEAERGKSKVRNVGLEGAKRVWSYSRF